MCDGRCHVFGEAPVRRGGRGDLCVVDTPGLSFLGVQAVMVRRCCGEHVDIVTANALHHVQHTHVLQQPGRIGLVGIPHTRHPGNRPRRHGDMDRPTPERPFIE